MRCLFIILLSLFICAKGSAQNAIKGVVYDANTKQPISFASVLLPELHLGTASLADGKFAISVSEKGKFILQVSYVGYESFFRTVQNPNDSVIEILLKPSLMKIKEVVVIGNQSTAPNETSFSVMQLSQKEIQQSGSLSLSDAIARMPGMSQLSTGVGISKPVIRGLYGNRIQINVNGMRFDNQQWQDEHGLGLSDMGVDRVEIIKGPSSVLYGADAMGGVLNIIEEKPALMNSLEQDFNFRLYSNTYGLSANYGIKKSNARSWFKIRAGADSHSDYSDGSNNRVLNSRFASYNFKASLGFNRKNSTSVNNLFVSYSKFGFVFDSLARKEEDKRISRSFDGPHHQVFFMQASSENTFYKSRRKIKLNGGLISNLRQEDEGGGGISLSMLLNSVSVVAQVNEFISKNSEWIYGTSLFIQTNTNYGGRIIIPNAVTGDASVFSLFRHTTPRVLVETGLRYDYKMVTTRATGSLNIVGNDSPTQEVVPFNKFYDAFNISAGSVIHVTNEFDIKFNTSSGYRPGNLAELSSNGLHEGSLRWEIGKSDAKIEQNINVEGTLLYEHEQLRVSLSGYQNYFWNYIYLAPTQTEYFGFQVYHFQQTDATLRGGEIVLDWNPAKSNVAFNTSYSFINARKSDGTYLPFIPANRTNVEVKYYPSHRAPFQDSFVFVGGTYTLAQNHPAEFETSTPDYFLLRAGASSVWKGVKWSLTCNNLLNEKYFDHLSRFKYYGIHNMGRNIVISANFTL